MYTACLPYSVPGLNWGWTGETAMCASWLFVTGQVNTLLHSAGLYIEPHFRYYFLYCIALHCTLSKESKLRNMLMLSIPKSNPSQHQAIPHSSALPFREIQPNIAKNFDPKRTTLIDYFSGEIITLPVFWYAYDKMRIVYSTSICVFRRKILLTRE